MTSKMRFNPYNFHVALLLIFTIPTIAFKPVKEEQTERKFSFIYSVTINEIPQETNQIEVFIPIPQSNTYQDITDLKISFDYDYEVLTDPEYKNKYLHLKLTSDIPEELELSFGVKINRKRAASGNYNRSTENIQRYLKPDKLVPIDGEIRQEALDLAGSSSSSTKSVKIIYNHLITIYKIFYFSIFYIFEKFSF